MRTAHVRERLKKAMKNKGMALAKARSRARTEKKQALLDERMKKIKRAVVVKTKVRMVPKKPPIGNAPINSVVNSFIIAQRYCAEVKIPPDYLMLIMVTCIWEKMTMKEYKEYGFVREMQKRGPINRAIQDGYIEVKRIKYFNYFYPTLKSKLIFDRFKKFFAENKRKLGYEIDKRVPENGGTRSFR